MERDEVRQIILRELPALIRQDLQVREWVQSLILKHTLPRAEAESRFEKMLAELRAMREESERRWEEQRQKWEEQQKKWEEQEMWKWLRNWASKFTLILQMSFPDRWWTAWLQL